jgi:ribosomal protein S18 acetylase RimI-like enzyme
MIVSCRAGAPEDEPFLQELILTHVALELGASHWPEPMRTHLLSVQYTSRRNSIRTRFPDAGDQVILLDGKPVGWLVVATAADEIRLVEILVATAERGKGIGAAVVSSVLSEAEKTGTPVRLSVDVANGRAIRLYERLGFRRIAGDEVRHFMECSP